MTNVDMIVWHGKGDESYSEDYWSTNRSIAPKIDDINSLVTTKEAYSRDDEDRI